MMKTNHAHVCFDACSENEGFARMVVMGFMMEMNPTMDELQDVKTAVSEAVTNAIIHGYGAVNEDKEVQLKCAQVEMTCIREGEKLIVSVEDHGVGITDVEEARQPFFTTKPNQDRSGMGFAFMESFMDEVEIVSKVNVGTRITMCKYIGKEESCVQEKGARNV